MVAGDYTLALIDLIWYAQGEGGKRIVVNNNTMAGRLYVVRAGIGITTLPHFFVAQDSFLVCVTDPVPKAKNELRLLNHIDLHNQTRTNTFIDFMVASLASDENFWRTAAH